MSAWLSGYGLLPHGYCLQWQPALLWTMAVADSVIAVSYFSIPFAIWYFARKRPDIPHRWLFVLFGLFIVSCGITHLLDVLNLWRPAYWLDAGMRVITAGLSLFTALVLWKVMPSALQAPSARQLQEQQQDLELAIDGARLGIWHWDLQLNRQVWSDNMLALYGFAPLTEITDDQILAAIHPDDRQRVAQANRHALASLSDYSEEYRILLPDGSVRWLHAMGRPFTDEQGKLQRMGGVVYDITQRKLDEERIWQAMRQAEESRCQVEVLNDALRERALQAEEASRAKSFFISNMSHEFRTPMAGILGFGEILQRKLSDPKLRDYADKILGSAESLMLILNNILDFSEFDKGTSALHLRQFQLQEVLPPLGRDFAPQASVKGLAFDLQVAPELLTLPLQGDPERLQRILQNFLDNALKFTPQGQIALRVQQVESQAGLVRLRFEIEDSGIGIPPELQQKIFEPFVQADMTSTRSYGGTGIGLSINRKLISLMGGELGMTSACPGGSTFWFTVPFATVGEAQQAGL